MGLSMSAADVFGIIVRTIGLICTLYGAHYLAYGLAWLSGAERPKDEGFKVTDYLFSGILYGVVGLALIFGAPTVVAFAY